MLDFHGASWAMTIFAHSLKQDFYSIEAEGRAETLTTYARNTASVADQ